MKLIPSSRTHADNIPESFGNGDTARLTWDTSDANANALVLELPAQAGADVPVFVIGTGESTALIGTDLGLFNGVTETTFGIQDSDGDTLLVMDYSADDAARIRTIGTTRDLTLDPTGNLVLTDGIFFMNDNANVKMTLGLTINQGAADNEVLAFKSSDIDHQVTGLAETDTYGYFQKESGGNAGMRMRGISLETVGLKLSGVSTNDDVDKTTSATGNIVLDTRKKAGSGSNVVGADGNCVTISNGTSTRFIFDTEGSGHADVEWVAFDSHDDIALINDIEGELRSIESPKGTAHRQMLEATGIIGKNSWHIENGKPRAMVNMTKLAMLHHGALMQVGERIEALETENTELRALVGGK